MSDEPAPARPGPRGTPAPVRPGPRGRVGPTATVAIVATAAVAYSIMQTMVMPAIPALGRELHVGPDAIVWVISAFFISSAVSIPVVGRLGDAYGRVRVLIAAMGLFTVATAAAAIAPNLEALVAARIVQGVGAAVFPLSYALVDELLPPARRTAGMGAISAAFGVGSAVGYVAGGPLLHVFGWRGIFVAGLVPAGLTLATLPLLPRRRGDARVRMDWVGAVSLAVALALLLVVISRGTAWGWTSPAVLALLAACAVSFAAVGVASRRHPSPLVGLPVLLGRRMLAINVSAVLLGYAFFAIFVLLPGWVTADPAVAGYGFSTSDEYVGLFFLPYAAAMVVGGSLAGRAGADRQATVLRVGVITVVVGLALLVVGASAPWSVVAAVAITGAGSSACLTALAQLVISVARPEDRSVAAGLNTMGRMVGMAAAAQLSGVLVAASAGPAGPTATGYAVGLAVAVVAGVLSLAATVGIRDPRPGGPASRIVADRPPGALRTGGPDAIMPTRSRSARR